MIVRREDGHWNRSPRSITLTMRPRSVTPGNRVRSVARTSPQACDMRLRSMTSAGWNLIWSHPLIRKRARHPTSSESTRRGTRTSTPKPSARSPSTDPTAAYLVSLHASGLYSRRYAWAGLKPVDWYSIGEHGRALLESERAFRTQLISKIPSAEAEFESTWRSYMLLETFDCLSLLTCFGFDCDRFGPVPTASGQWEMLTVRRAGPWVVELDPFPFAAPELVVEVPCRRFDQERFASADELRDALACDPEDAAGNVLPPVLKRA